MHVQPESRNAVPEYFRLAQSSVPARREIVAADHVAVYCDRHRPTYWAEHAREAVGIWIASTGRAAEFAWRENGRRLLQRAAGDGEVVIVGPGQQHSCLLRKRCDLVVLFVRPDYAERISQTVLTGVQFIHFDSIARRVPVILDLLEQLRLMARTSGPVDRDYTLSLGTVFAVRLLSGMAPLRSARLSVRMTRGLSADALQRVIDYIHAHLDSSLTVEQLADAARHSRAHFIELFKVSTGVVPSRYVKRERVMRALRELMTTEDKVTDVAVRCGFSDHSHMTRSFRDILGYTPQAARENGQLSRRIRRSFKIGS